MTEKAVYILIVILLVAFLIAIFKFPRNNVHPPTTIKFRSFEFTSRTIAITLITLVFGTFLALIYILRINRNNQAKEPGPSVPFDRVNKDSVGAARKLPDHAVSATFLLTIQTDALDTVTIDGKPPTFLESHPNIKIVKLTKDVVYNIKVNNRTSRTIQSNRDTTINLDN